MLFFSFGYQAKLKFWRHKSELEVIKVRVNCANSLVQRLGFFDGVI